MQTNQNHSAQTWSVTNYCFICFISSTMQTNCVTEIEIWSKKPFCNICTNERLDTDLIKCSCEERFCKFCMMQFVPTSKDNEPTVIKCPLCSTDVSQLNEFTKIVWKQKEKNRKKTNSLIGMYEEMQNRFVEEKMKSSQLQTKLKEVKQKKSRLNKMIIDFFEMIVPISSIEVHQ